MITFSCQAKEKIVLPTLGVTVKVVKIERGVVHLSIEAPPEIPLLAAAAPGRAKQPSAAPPHEERPADEGNQTRFMSRLSDRLGTTAMELGLLRLRLDAGMTEEAKAALVGIQEEFQLLRHGVEAEREQAAQTASRARKPRKALLVEDDCNERELLAGFLRHSGLKVETAGDGSDALDYLGSHGRPDVILLDMGLPCVDGPTTVRAIRGNPAFAGIKIFGVTGHRPEEFDLEYGPHGIDRWFHKPLDPAVLIHDLTEELDGFPCGV